MDKIDRLNRAAELLAQGQTMRQALAVPYQEDQAYSDWEQELWRIEDRLMEEFGFDARGGGMWTDAYEVCGFTFSDLLD